MVYFGFREWFYEMGLLNLLEIWNFILYFVCIKWVYLIYWKPEILYCISVV